MYYVYLIRNTKTRELYIGYTKDLKRRIAEHTNKNPELLYYESYKADSDARRREKMLKQRGQSIRRLKDRIKNSLS
jgi:predicted GIY-YIG superfamily endonuclease